ncbi:DUF3263 domain-containing protein [Nocardioides xinjiangensis]|uniref:DUF3263 domain-containing protein n=1 Tax=Nocardioides xinjiangensis TaxID=2817376 RepID=UPI001B3003DA|nr:DUF3263 domain-containing protein [Nocardioides sp. SYSU D00778]
MQPLSDFERSVLDFERALWRHLRAKEEAIEETFGVSPARYFRFLDVIISKDAALRHDPLLVRRLRRLRDTRVADRRSARRPGPGDEREA